MTLDGWICGLNPPLRSGLTNRVAGGHEELTRWLIREGALVKPYTRLLCNTAVRMKHADLIPVLVQGGADRDLVKSWGKI